MERGAAGANRFELSKFKLADPPFANSAMFHNLNGLSSFQSEVI